MESVLTRVGSDPWVHYYLAYLRAFFESGEAAVLEFETAVSLFRTRGQIDGVAWGQWALAAEFRLLGMYEKAEELIGQARDSALLSDSNRAMAVVFRELGQQAIKKRGGFQSAYQDLLTVEDEWDGSVPLCSVHCKETLANLAYHLGQFEVASRRFQNVVEQAQREDAKNYSFVTLMSTIVQCELDDRSVSDTESARNRAITGFEEALGAAKAQRNDFMMARSHQMLGRLLEGEVAEFHLEKCVETGRKAKRPLSVADCLNGLALRRLDADPSHSLGMRNEALAIARDENDPWFEAYVWHHAMAFDWKMLRRQEAVERSFSALKVIERLRSLQASSEGRATIFSGWTDPYRSLFGRLLSEEFGAYRHEDIVLAFAVSERLRARVLLDVLTSVRATAAILPDDDPLEVQRQEVLRKIVALQRSLFEVGLGGEVRKARLELLGHLESKVKRLSEKIAQAYPHFAQIERLEFSGLEDVRRGLASDEALLSFQIAREYDLYGDFMGGSWLMAITRDAVEVTPLPDGRQLRPLVELHSSQLAERREDDLGLGRSLHADLLADGLASLPSGIERLIIVPDGPLHLLPFSSLADAADAPLASRYQISVVPSASLWLRWRRAERAPRANAALIMADPETVGTGRRADGDGLRTMPAEPPLPPLPQAQREGRAVARYLGATSELLLGAAASERMIKEAALDDYGLVHFAAHAIVHQDEPERSAIMLAPGGDDEDGLLQIREIVNLDLDGRVVVLSACSSAAGQILRGEGVMSLARGFFQAGARAVVGSLWPLEDTEAAALFDTFYQRLTRGDSLDVALRHAQAERRDAGASEVDWAGVQVFGDGGFVPFPGGIEQSGVPWRLALVATLIVLALIGVASRRSTSAPR